MIQPTELRVWNLFNVSSDKAGLRIPGSTIYKVLNIDTFSVKACECHLPPATVKNWNEFDYRDMEPIQLTEEWMLRFGYFNAGSNYWKSDERGVWLIFQTGRFHTTGLKWGRTVEYVHTFQNLYFALTGEELTIK